MTAAEKLTALSPQARWYFRGPMPVYKAAAHGGRKAEPTALAECVAAGLMSELPAMWVLTPLGREARGECRGCGKLDGAGHWPWCPVCVVCGKEGKIDSESPSGRDEEN